MILEKSQFKVEVQHLLKAGGNRLSNAPTNDSEIAVLALARVSNRACFGE
jgi:hypothetical protein